QKFPRNGYLRFSNRQTFAENFLRKALTPLGCESELRSWLGQATRRLVLSGWALSAPASSAQPSVLPALYSPRQIVPRSTRTAVSTPSATQFQDAGTSWA